MPNLIYNTHDHVKKIALNKLPDNLHMKNLLDIRKSQSKLDESTGVTGMI